jgi:hypothetical protein
MKAVLPNCIHIGNVCRKTHLFNLRNWHGGVVNAVVNTDTSVQTLAQLFRLLDEPQIDYKARWRHRLASVRRRPKQDIDLIMDASSLPSTGSFNRNL